MSWRIEGRYFQSCTCEVACPCSASLALGAHYDRCQVVLVFTSTARSTQSTAAG